MYLARLIKWHMVQEPNVPWTVFIDVFEHGKKPRCAHLSSDDENVIPATKLPEFANAKVQMISLVEPRLIVAARYIKEE